MKGLLCEKVVKQQKYHYLSKGKKSLWLGQVG